MQRQPDRIEQLKADVAELRVTDPSASRDQLSTRLGVAGMVLGVVLGVYAYTLSYSAEGGDAALQQNDAVVVALIGVVLAVAGAALYLKGAVASFLRFWLVRDLHERRAQTDRIVVAIGGRSEATPEDARGEATPEDASSAVLGGGELATEGEPT